MTAKEFNEKYKSHLEEGHYGLAIENQAIISYLDKEFEAEIQENPDFTFSQIKFKFGMPRVYTSSFKSSKWEYEIDNMSR
jgi:hypothetical protein